MPPYKSGNNIPASGCGFYFLFFLFFAIIVTTIQAARKTPAIIKRGMGREVPVIGLAANNSSIIIAPFIFFVSLVLLNTYYIILFGFCQ